MTRALIDNANQFADAFAERVATHDPAVQDLVRLVAWRAYGPPARRSAPMRVVHVQGMGGAMTAFIAWLIRMVSKAPPAAVHETAPPEVSAPYRTPAAADRVYLPPGEREARFFVPEGYYWRKP